MFPSLLVEEDGKLTLSISESEFRRPCTSMQSLRNPRSANKVPLACGAENVSPLSDNVFIRSVIKVIA
jgi:hypothetical protein